VVPSTSEERPMAGPYFFPCGYTAQVWAMAVSMKLSASFRLLDLGLLGRVISSSRGLCVSAPGDCDDGEVGGIKLFWHGKPKYSEKTCPATTYPP
jgi:hypothetical protein